jgi:hypothetical protein
LVSTGRDTSEYLTLPPTRIWKNPWTNWSPCTGKDILSRGHNPLLPSNFFLFKIKSIILFLILLKVRPAYHKLDAPNNLFKAIRQS